jgi:hypothetical protein
VNNTAGGRAAQGANGSRGALTCRPGDIPKPAVPPLPQSSDGQLPTLAAQMDMLLSK